MKAAVRERYGAPAGTVRPAIDRRYPLDDIVDALRYVDTGGAKGKVLITV